MEKKETKKEVKKAQYTYEGSFRGMDIGGESHILHAGKDYSLPVADEKVKTMIRRKELIEVKPPKAKK